MKVVVTYLNRYNVVSKVSFPKLNNFTRGLVVDTLQLPYVVYKFGFGPASNTTKHATQTGYCWLVWPIVMDNS